MAITPSPEEVNTFHLNSDRDSSATALHHTLGQGPYQASPGSHTHDGKNSKRIKFSDIDGAWFDLDGGTPYSVYTPIPSLDGGGI